MTFGIIFGRRIGKRIGKSGFMRSNTKGLRPDPGPVFFNHVFGKPVEPIFTIPRPDIPLRWFY